MASAGPLSQHAETDAVASGGAGNISEYSGNTDIDEMKAQNEEYIEEEEVAEPSENLTACLQVVGAFFMMFNSWCVAPLTQQNHALTLEQGNLQYLWSISNIL